ncbi:MAG: ABC transporter permease [Acetivibrio sp.]
MNGIKTVAGKELARVFGDKKLVFSLFIMPAVLMFVLYSIMGKAMSSMMNDIEKHVPVVYIQNAPEGFEGFEKTIKKEVSATYIDKSENTDSIKGKIKAGETDLLLVFPDSFLESIKNYKKGVEIPEVKTYYNPSEDYSSEARENYVNEILKAYQQSLLKERFGDLESLTAFSVDLDESSSIIMDENKAGGKMIAMMLPYLIVMLLFTGPMSLGVDAIAGEKERGTMASMLVAPVKRREIVVGKILALSILSCLSAIVYAVSVIISVPRMFGGMDMGGFTASAKFSILQILQLLVIMISLVYFYVAIITLVSVFAKTVKEAGTYISPIYIIVIVAGVLTMFSGNNQISLPAFAIPVYGSAAAIQRVITGELTASQFGTSIIGIAVLSIILTGLITKAFNSEKIMFNA